jgi:3D (Asp-Asp-Asp) domain-containing protein
MATRNTYVLTRQPFIVERASLRRNSGRQIDWDQVPESRRQTNEVVTINDAGAAIGDTSITVDALPVAILAGTFLNFGTYAPVTVTVNDADVNAGETSITVAALSGPIPAGTRLEFTGAGAGYAQTTADAIAGATTLTVEALPEDIDNAATALFAGGTIGARVTANAAAGATTLTVDELQFGIADNSTANVPGLGKKAYKAGTVLAELSGGKCVARADRPGSETATCILETAACEDDIGDPGYGCLVGGQLYENLLPDAVAGDVSSTYWTELATNGCAFNREDYGDTTAE